MRVVFIELGALPELDEVGGTRAEVAGAPAYLRQRPPADSREVADLLLARGPELDWDRLKKHFDGHEQILLAAGKAAGNCKGDKAGKGEPQAAVSTRPNYYKPRMKSHPRRRRNRSPAMRCRLRRLHRQR